MATLTTPRALAHDARERAEDQRQRSQSIVIAESDPAARERVADRRPARSARRARRRDQRNAYQRTERLPVTSSAAPAASAISPKTRRADLAVDRRSASADCVLVPRSKVAGLLGLASAEPDQSGSRPSATSDSAGPMRWPARPEPGDDRLDGELVGGLTAVVVIRSTPSPGLPADGRDRRPRSRKMTRTSSGAAMKITISAWITVHQVERRCRRPTASAVPPAAARRTAGRAATTPHGLTRPSSATRMPSKPIAATTSPVSAAPCRAPSWRRPARPAHRPASP